MKLRIVVLAAAVLSLAACGSSHGTNSTGKSATPTTTAVQATTASDDGGGCGSDVVASVQKAVASSAVRKVEVIGGCSEVSIETSLAPGSLADAGKICEAASKVAYTGSVTAVSVEGADGHELSAGEKGAPCI